MTPLPIDALLPDVRAALAEHGAVVLEAPPGTGKTTRVPPALVCDGQVWVLEPRRIAARLAAARVASERGTPLGAEIGYAMRFDRKAGPDTKVLYVTEALLTRRLAEDPRLRGIGAVVLDEFHERSLHTDVALASVRALRRERSELKLVVMSATLDGERVARWLGCPRLRAEGTLHPVEISYYARKDERPIEQKVLSAVRATEGDTLVFLPGVGEIRRCQELLPDALPLHGDLDAAEQDRALRPSGGGPAAARKIILATNVAETSITVEGVRVVIDTGLARVPGHDPWSGLGTLELQPISRASAAQRAGRAGRTGPGQCLRLYTKAEHDARPADTPPEIVRADLAELALDLGGRALDWLDPPPPAAWKAALDLLERLGAVHGERLTDLGAAMRRLPTSPRLARFLLTADDPDLAAAVASLFGRGRGDLVARAREGERGDPRAVRQLRTSGGTLPVERALFEAFRDRVGQRRGTRVLFAEGGRGECEHGPDAFVVVTEAERVGPVVKVRSMTPIPADWLLDGAEVREDVSWTGTRVEVREQLRFGALVLEDAPGRGDPDAVARVLREHLVPHRDFPDWDRAVALKNRVDWLRRQGFALAEVDLDALVLAACQGCRSLADLGPLAPHDPEVDRLAPEFVALPGRKRAPVTYPEDGEPFVSSRMQDFFGLREGPRVANGRPLVLHLLAPSNRPVQVTSDLAGFWERHWPGIRKELMRKYPRHKWPEDPRLLYTE